MLAVLMPLCNYQERESEQWIGEWMKERDCRDEMVRSRLAPPS